MDDALRAMAEEAGIEIAGSDTDIPTTVMSVDPVGNLSLVWEADGIQAQVNDIDRNRRELSCYLSIREFGGKNVRWICAPVRINLMSSSAKTALRRELESRKQLNWPTRLDQIVVAVHKAASEQRKPGVLAPRATLAEQDFLLAPIAERNQHSMLVAAGGTGKSLLSLSVCASVVSGKQIVPGLTPGPFTQNCLYLDWETDQETHERRLTQLAAGVGMEFPAGRIHYIRMTVPLSEDVQYIYEYIKKNNIGLVITDSVGMATGGDMNSQADAIAYVSAARAIGDVTMLSIHHVGWGATDRNTGSRYFENAARSVWVLEKDQDSNTPESHLDLTHRKANNGLLQKPIGIRVEFGEAIRYYADTVSDAKLPITAQIEDVLSVGKLSLQAIYADMDRVEKNAIRQALGRMVKSGVVNKWDGTDRRNPEYGLAAQDDFHGSVTKEIRHRDVTDRGSVTHPSINTRGALSHKETPELSDKEENQLMVEEQKEWWQND